MNRRIKHEKEVLRDYHEWLVSLVDTPDKDFRYHYVELMDILDTVEFRPIFEKDNNRVEDGLELREKFCDEFWVDFDIRKGFPCTILECFVALFVRYSDTILCENGDPSVAPELFFDALESLNLLKYDDFTGDKNSVIFELSEFLSGKITLFGEKKADLFMQVGKFSMKKYDF